MNYQEHLATGGAPELTERADARRGVVYVCPVCSGTVHACLLASMAGLPNAFTGGAAWACDGCWSGWQRNMIPIADGDDFVVPEEWFQAFVARTGRDAGNRDAILGRDYARELDRINVAAAGLDPASPEAVELAARRTKVLARATFPGTWSTTSIIADGVDVAVLSGVPVGTEVIVDGVSHVVDDGDFEMAATTPGAYRVQARHPRFIWQEWVINAN